MAPLIVLLVSAIVFWLTGLAGVRIFHDPSLVLRAALALMFCLTASAHWGKRRPDLIRMVPSALPHPDWLVTITGVLELLGAVGLLVPNTARAACICLAVMLLALFPANVRAARQHLTIAGQPVPNLPVRGLIQVVFIGTLAAAAWLR
ncbi:MAG TPA: DoxX family protein [Acidobacteriaceae bacterium]|nr:DoxX family protein [Acidobacteriaceae bacterium]